MSSLTAISPIDGRYASKVSELSVFFSEQALMRYRLLTEIAFFIALSEEKGIEGLKKLTKTEINYLHKIVHTFNTDIREAKKIKDIEKTTNHDVKAVEYYLKTQLQKSTLKRYTEFVHFACTSEDINNISYALMLKDSLSNVMIPAIDELIKYIAKLAIKWKDESLLARTHGQPASPTTVGKEFLVYQKRLERQREMLKNQEINAKLNGATGNYNAHTVAYPNINWPRFTERFIKKLKLTPNLYTTQIEPHDSMAETFDVFGRINNIILDLNRDMWMYISREVFKQKTLKGEIGSSAMPHKVNPIDFENSEGNVGLANALFRHMSEKLMSSRWQRDLSDSTVQRNIGSAFAYTLLALKSTMKGLSKIELNKTFIQEELDNNWEVLAEAIQTVMRKYAIPKPYEKLKELTRGKRLSREKIQNFVRNLKLPEEEKTRLLKLSPHNYIGQVDKLFCLSKK